MFALAARLPALTRMRILAAPQALLRHAMPPVPYSASFPSLARPLRAAPPPPFTLTAQYALACAGTAFSTSRAPNLRSWLSSTYNSRPGVSRMSTLSVARDDSPGGTVAGDTSALHPWCPFDQEQRDEHAWLEAAPRRV